MLVRVDPDARRVELKYSIKKGALPDQLSIGPGKPISTDALKEAIFRFADSLLHADGRYAGLISLLKLEPPQIAGHSVCDEIIDTNQVALPQIINAIANLDSSYIFVQGPPGSGKTYTGSHVIVDLMKRGFRIGISSNSHKVINNLLIAVEKVAKDKKFNFVGVKKSTKEKTESHINGEFIQDVFTNDDVVSALSDGAKLVAGTAWLFANPELDQMLDFLFIDEAGQVALANLVAMSTSAKNIVLLGDQMQLGQPTQGIHPGRSGESSLEYLLNDLATIPPERGIFLKTTFRMHPDICRFISDAVYDGRLEAEVDNANQRLVLKGANALNIKPTGIHYLAIDHDACSQQSEEEAALVKLLFAELLQQEYTDKDGTLHPITAKNILVLSPYNMQVNLLKQALPVDARIGTVDKLQGQEAEAVIISMTTSSGEYLPRFIEFLYSKNRLNVAISRAKCVAFLIANPALMSIRCSTPQDMAMVNTLCWVKEFN